MGRYIIDGISREANPKETMKFMEVAADVLGDRRCAQIFGRTFSFHPGEDYTSVDVKDPINGKEFNQLANHGYLLFYRL